MFRKKPGPPAPAHAAAVIDWSLVSNVQREWPLAGADPDTDLQIRAEALRLYESTDDYFVMMRVAGMLCQSLRHNLYGPGLLSRSDLFETTNALLYAGVEAPPDGQTFSDQTQRQVRLGLTICKKYGWQSGAHGGTGELTGLLTASDMLYSLCVANEGEFVGSLETFFQTNPIPHEAPAVRRPVVEERSSLAEGLALSEKLLEEAQAGDQGDIAAKAYLQGVFLQPDDPRGALVLMEEAGELGHLEAMYTAGSLSEQLGRLPASAYWYELAANAGHPKAAGNLAFAAEQRGDRATAARWAQRQGELGEGAGYAALTQFAAEAGDKDAEFTWSRLGADLDQDFCQQRYAQLLMQRNPDNPPVLQTALGYAIRSGEQGNNNGFWVAGIVSSTLGDRAAARAWLLKAEQAGHPDARRVIDKYGL